MPQGSVSALVLKGPAKDIVMASVCKRSSRAAMAVAVAGRY